MVDVGDCDAVSAHRVAVDGYERIRRLIAAIDVFEQGEP